MMGPLMSPLINIIPSQYTHRLLVKINSSTNSHPQELLIYDLQVSRKLGLIEVKDTPPLTTESHNWVLISQVPNNPLYINVLSASKAFNKSPQEIVRITLNPEGFKSLVQAKLEKTLLSSLMLSKDFSHLIQEENNGQTQIIYILTYLDNPAEQWLEIFDSYVGVIFMVRSSFIPPNECDEWLQVSDVPPLFLNKEDLVSILRLPINEISFACRTPNGLRRIINTNARNFFYETEDIIKNCNNELSKIGQNYNTNLSKVGIPISRINKIRFYVFCQMPRILRAMERNGNNFYRLNSSAVAGDIDIPNTIVVHRNPIDEQIAIHLQGQKDIIFGRGKSKKVKPAFNLMKGTLHAKAGTRSDNPSIIEDFHAEVENLRIQGVSTRISPLENVIYYTSKTQTKQQMTLPVLIDFLVFFESIKNSLTEKDKCSFMIQLLEAVYEAHSIQVLDKDNNPVNKPSITHKDIKLANFLYDPLTKIIYLADLGYVDDIKYPHAGSKNHAAPEVYNTSHIPNRKQDIFSLGVCFYYILHDSFPFRTWTEGTETKVIPSDSTAMARHNRIKLSTNPLDKIITRMLSINSDDRPDTLEALAEFYAIRQWI